MMTIEIFAPAVLRIRSRCSTMTHIHSLRGARHADINDIYLGKNNPNIIGLILYKDTASQELINLARHTRLFFKTTCMYTTYIYTACQLPVEDREISNATVVATSDQI